MTGEENGKRRRGIRASKVKLTRALSDAGLKTQAALADRIADLEELEAAPRDMVSRAFRELPVEARSIDRIARALGVDVDSLLKTPDESEGVKISDVGNERTQAAKVEDNNKLTPGSALTGFWSNNRWLKLAAPAIGLALIAGWVLYGALTPAPQNVAARRQLTMGDMSVLVLPTFGDTDGALSRALRQALRSDFNITADTAVTTPPPYDLSALAKRLRADLVVETELVVEHRLMGVRAFVFHDGVRQQLWSDSFPRIALDERRPDIAEKMAFALRHYVGKEKELPHFPLAAVQDDYLLGEFYLDEPSSELNIKRAETRFEAVLRQDPDYAKAHAGLCQALMEAHWMLEEDRMLEDAKTACNQALLLAPDDPVVKIAQAHFLRRTGRNDEAMALYQAIIEQNPNYPSAYSGLAAGWLDIYRQDGERTALDAAITANRKAADLDQTLWKPLFHLALNQWFADDVEAGITTSEEALQRQENEFVLANLGTFYVCVGNFERARATYERALEIAPESYVGSEFLATVYYYLGDYKEAIRLRRKAIDSIGTGAPEIHEMWGDLGDAYRQNGDRPEAIAAYRQAADIAERDHVRGRIPVADRAARAYYYTVLRHLDKTTVTDAIDREIAESLNEIADAQFESSAQRHMAQTWLLRGDIDRARKGLEAISEKCPGYGQTPDLKHLAQNTE
ncbi:MAG: tetratricopeptide repeat protein [Alphaproteobacteria bacterium]|nr:tetratricopeptide repeat protein [Alphaproteobacteria bacterium]